MQQAASKLAKLMPVSAAAYSRWSLFGILLQAPLNALTFPTPLDVATADPIPMPLKLVGTMMGKQINAPGFDCAEMLHVYVDVLEEMRDFDTLATTLESDVCVKLWRNAVPRERLRRLAKTWIHAQKWDKAWHACIGLLEEDPDDWFAWLGALDVLAHDSAKRQELWAKACSWKEKGGVRIRGAHLVGLELRKRGFDIEGLGSAEHLVTEYFAHFGHKAVFVEDVLPYLDDDAMCDALEAGLNAEPPCTGKAEDKSACVAWATQWINCGLMRDHFRRACTADDVGALLATAKTALERFCITNAWELPYEHRESPQAGDAFVVMAARALLDVASVSSPDVAMLMRVHAVAVIDHALEATAFNTQLKMLRVSALTALCAFLPANGTRLEMDMRNIQTETLSHIFLEPLLAGAHRRQAEELISDILTFHKDCSVTIPEYILQAFQKENYSRVVDIWRYGLRTKHSHTLAVAEVERAHCVVARTVTSHGGILGALQSARGMYFGALPSLLQQDVLDGLVFNEDEEATSSTALRVRAHPPVDASATLGVPKAERLAWLRLRVAVLVVLSGEDDAAAALTAWSEAATVLKDQPAMAQYQLLHDLQTWTDNAKALAAWGERMVALVDAATEQTNAAVATWSAHIAAWQLTADVITRHALLDPKVKKTPVGTALADALGRWHEALTDAAKRVAKEPVPMPEALLCPEKVLKTAWYGIRESLESSVVQLMGSVGHTVRMWKK